MIGKPRNSLAFKSFIFYSNFVRTTILSLNFIFSLTVCVFLCCFFFKTIKDTLKTDIVCCNQIGTLLN